MTTRRNGVPNRLIMITKSDCPYCDKAKEYLAIHGIPFDARTMDSRPEREKLYDKLGLTGNKRSVPQIFLVDTIDDRSVRVGGYAEMVHQNLASLKSEIVE